MLSSLLPTTAKAWLANKEKHVFIDKSVTLRRSGASEISKRGLQVVREPGSADVVLVKDLASPPWDLQCSLSMQGGRLATPTFFGSLPQCPSIKYMPGVLFKQMYLYLSTRCRAERPKLCAIIREAVRLPSSKWILVAEHVMWLEHWRRHPSQSTALYTTDELPSLGPPPKGGVPCSVFLKQVAQIHTDSSGDGMRVPCPERR